MANWTTLRQLSPSLSVKLVSCLLVTILFITPKTRRRGRKRSSSSPLPLLEAAPLRSNETKRNETKGNETKRNETSRRVVPAIQSCAARLHGEEGGRGVSITRSPPGSQPRFSKKCALLRAQFRERGIAAPPSINPR